MRPLLPSPVRRRYPCRRAGLGHAQYAFDGRHGWRHIGSFRLVTTCGACVQETLPAPLPHALHGQSLCPRAAVWMLLVTYSVCSNLLSLRYVTASRYLIHSGQNTCTIVLHWYNPYLSMFILLSFLFLVGLFVWLIAIRIGYGSTPISYLRGWI